MMVRHNLILPTMGVVFFSLVKMHSLFSLSLVVGESCVAAIGGAFSVRSFGCALFC